MERKKDEEKKEKKEKEEIKKLNRALHFAVMKICEQEGTFFFFSTIIRYQRIDFAKNATGRRYGFKPSKEIIFALSKVIRSYIAVFTKDVSSFASHAKRSTILPADVFLAARKSPTLVRHLKKFNELYALKQQKQRSK